MSRSRHRNRPVPGGWVPLRHVASSGDDCFEVVDSSTTSVPANLLLRGQAARDPAALIARLAGQLREQNRPALARLGVDVQARYDGSEVRLEVSAGTTIGAVPLRSPLSGRTELG